MVSLAPSDTVWRQRNWTTLDLGNGWLPDGTKPLFESMLTYLHYSPMSFTRGQFNRKMSQPSIIKTTLNITYLKFYSNISNLSWTMSWTRTLGDCVVACFVTITVGGKHCYYLHYCENIFSTSNGSWCMGIKGEMSGTVCVTFTWYMYIYELFIAFVCFVVCSLL